MKNVLITGGAGFIGSEIVSQLYRTGLWNITVLDSLNEQIHGKEPEKSFLYQKVQGKCKFVKGSVTDIDTVVPLVKDAEYIIHLAAETGTGQSMYQINLYNETNVMGTSNVLQAISLLGQESRVKKIILSSSRSVYGEGKYECPNCGVIYPDCRDRERMQNGDFYVYCPYCGEKLKLVKTTEDSAVKPASLYAFTKYTQELMLRTMCPALNVDYTIFRFQNVYGVGQSLMNPYTGILSIFSSLMLENKPINVFEDGLESRDFINVVDVAAGVIASLDNEKSNGETINLGSGKGTTVLSITEILKKAYKSNSVINITGDFRLGDIAHNIADITKAGDILGFSQSVGIEEGLSQFCEWVKGQEHDNSGYENSLNELEQAGMFIRR
mgnify:CR=1 FL=1